MKFSIIICTYNPAPETFTRLLEAVKSFTEKDFQLIIVDNNSRQSVKESEAVKHVISLISDVLIIEEKKPGLTAARIAGINAAKYNWIIFFDDDNQPASNYITVAGNLINNYENVGAWGPGTVEVSYLGRETDWLRKNKELFQYRKESQTLINNKTIWQKCYPFGTGLIIKSEIAKTYVLNVISGRYTLSDRKGKSLASGGDVQMVLTAIKMGFYAGVCPQLQLTHNIEIGKADIKYLRKQQYGTSSASIKAHNEVFPTEHLSVRKVTNIKILEKLYSLNRIYRKELSRDNLKLLVAEKMGEMNAAVYASGNRKPFLLKCYEKIIND